MARIGRAAAKLQDIARKGSVVETIVKPKQTIKLYEDKDLVAATKSASVKTQTGEHQKRFPLKEVVTDCTKRWFQDSLKEAKAGDIGMQVLVGQMYCRGYGIPRDIKKGKTWFQKASKSRLKILNLCAKPPDVLQGTVQMSQIQMSGLRSKSSSKLQCMHVWNSSYNFQT